MKEVIRMSDSASRKARALIKALCANYNSTTGGCLLLDDGEVVKCPQMISQSLICRYFRDVLLEDKDGKALKAEIMGADYRKVCAVCGEHFRAVSNRAKYCARCSKKTERERKAEWARNKRVK